MLQYISIKLTDRFEKRMTLSEIDRLKMILGLENLLHQILLCSVIFAAACCMDVQAYALLFFLIFGIYRLLAGGFHLSTSLGCTIATTSIIVGGTKLAMMLFIKAQFIPVIFALLLILVFCFAPRRTANYPVDKPTHRRLKVKSAVFVAFCGILSFFCPHGIREIIILSVLAETLTLIPKNTHK